MNLNVESEIESRRRLLLILYMGVCGVWAPGSAATAVFQFAIAFGFAGAVPKVAGVGRQGSFTKVDLI